MRPRWPPLFGGLLLAPGCATDRRHDARAPLEPNTDRQCGPAFSDSGPRPLPPLTETEAANAATAPARLSPRSLQMAEILGAGGLVRQIEDAASDASRGNLTARLTLLQARQQLSDRILLALLDAKSAAAEADCEEERADGLADRLQDLQEQRVKQLTILSLVVAGIGSIVSSGLALGAEATAVGVVARGVEATVGSMALFVGSEDEFRHRRNLLREVWAGPRYPRLMPFTAWRFINRPSRDDRGRRCLRETLVEHWRRDGRLGEAGSADERHRIALFFGSGGVYTIDELRDRAAMLDMLEADINLMSHDLDHFLHEILPLAGD